MIFEGIKRFISELTELFRGGGGSLMVLFKDLTPEIRTALEWFKGLPSERQAAIVVDYFKDATKLAKDEADSFGAIVSEIRVSLASSSKAEVAKALVALGVDDTLSNLMVEKTGPASLESCIIALRDVPDSLFDQLMFEIMENFFLDWKQFKFEEAAKRVGTNTSIVQSAMILVRDGLVDANLRGNLSMDSVKKFLMNKYAYSLTKVRILERLYEKRREEIRLSLMYGKLQDTGVELQKVTQSLSEISQSLKEILQILKGEAKKSYIT